jgi:hypothetical protein
MLAKVLFPAFVSPLTLMAVSMLLDVVVCEFTLLELRQQESTASVSAPDGSPVVVGATVAIGRYTSPQPVSISVADKIRTAAAAAFQMTFIRTPP